MFYLPVMFSSGMCPSQVLYAVIIAIMGGHRDQSCPCAPGTLYLEALAFPSCHLQCARSQPKPQEGHRQAAH